MLDEQIIRSFDEDLIGFEPTVESLARLVRSADRHGELYAVFGPWGSGKTCFLQLLATKVESSATWIQFDALRHQATEDVLTALVAHVAREALRSGDGTDDIKRSFLRTARALTMSVADIALRSVAAGYTLEDVEKRFTTAEGAEAPGIPESPADALRSHMEMVVKAIMSKTERQTVVIAVDNLDRCRPDAVLRFIEALLVFNEVPNLRVIVAADREALIGFVNNQFAGTGFDGALYLEKIFPHTISVPEAGGKESNGGRLISSLVESLDNQVLDAHKPIIAEFLGAASATRNPRRAKKILRRLSRLQQVEHAQELYIIMMGIVLAETWPLLYHWFWVCPTRHWGDMMPELQGKGGGARPSSATEQSQEFLRGANARLGASRDNNIMTDLELLRRTVTRHRLLLDI